MLLELENSENLFIKWKHRIYLYLNVCKKSKLKIRNPNLNFVKEQCIMDKENLFLQDKDNVRSSQHN